MSSPEQNTETPSNQPLITNANELINQRAESAVVPKEFSNTEEYTRRMEQAEQRYATNKYVTAIQSNTPFDLKETLDSVAVSETPNNLHARSATIENRMLGDAAVAGESDRLSGDGAEKLAFLEGQSDRLRRQTITGNKVTSQDLAAAGCAAESLNLTGVDVANVAQINGVRIDPEVLAALQSIKGSMCQADNEAKTPATAGSAEISAQVVAR